MTAPAHELIFGGARSGKSRTAAARAAAGLAAGGSRRATLIASALAGDGEMAARIARHRADRAARLPALDTVEAPRALGAARPCPGRRRATISSTRCATAPRRWCWCPTRSAWA